MRCASLHSPLPAVPSVIPPPPTPPLLPPSSFLLPPVSSLPGLFHFRRSRPGALNSPLQCPAIARACPRATLARWRRAATLPPLRVHCAKARCVYALSAIGNVHTRFIHRNVRSTSLPRAVPPTRYPRDRAVRSPTPASPTRAKHSIGTGTAARSSSPPLPPRRRRRRRRSIIRESTDSSNTRVLFSFFLFSL